jgi:hypothetical protein
MIKGKLVIYVKAGQFGRKFGSGSVVSTLPVYSPNVYRIGGGARKIVSI